MRIRSGLVVLLISSVANEFHSPQHLPNSKESYYLGPYHTCCGHLLGVEISDSTQKGLWRVGTTGFHTHFENTSRISDGVDQWLCIFLERSEVSDCAIN